MAQLLSATNQADGFHGAIGIGVATTAAVSAGAGSVPTPLTEQDWNGWIYHKYFNINAASVMDSGAATDIDIQNSVTACHRFDYDSKAMRKLSDADTIYGCIEVTEIGTATMNFSSNCRMLFKLH